jgi:hypothetical protein
VALADWSSQPPPAPRIEGKPFAPSARALGPDVYELDTLSDDVAEMVEELRLLGISVPNGTVPRLVEAKHDPAAWHRDEQGDDAVTRSIVRRRWVFDWSAAAIVSTDLGPWLKSRKRAKAERRVEVDAQIVAVSDWQLGKVDVRGGTPEFLEAFTVLYGRLLNHVKSARPARIVVGDLGDCVENFDNTPVQAYTNDLSLPEQIDLYAALTHRIVFDLAEIAPVTFAAVPSNHGQVRRSGSKGSAWKPTDDWGIANARGLARTVLALGRDDINVVIPEPYAESLSIDVAGLPVAFAHGHQVGQPEQMVKWWKGQAFGQHPAANARLLLTGHVHHLRVQQVSRDRHWIAAPAMDGGSAWWTNVSGDDAGRGILTLSVTAGKWDNLRVIG